MPEQNIDPTEEGRKGGATATPASSVRVYDQPQRRGNPLARIIPIVLVLAALAYLLSRAMNRPEQEQNRQPAAAQQSGRNATSDEMNPSGPQQRGNSGGGVSNPPGPAGANSSSGSGGGR